MRVAQPEKQTARPGLLILFVVLSIVLITLWYREAPTGPLHRVRLFVHAVSAPVSAGGEFVTRPVRGFFAWASDLGVSRSQLEQLRDQNAQLRLKVAELEEARLENDRLRGLLALPQTKEREIVGARVIGRPADSWEGVITIDRGTADGLKAGMPVLGPQGLLGQTIDVTSSSARVRLITDPQSGVAAMVQSTRTEGVVHGSLDGKLTLDFVSREATVTAGDVVITSGLGGVFPKGVIIGEVSSVKSGPNALYKSIRIDPPGNLSRLEEVTVLVSEGTPPEVGGGE